MDRDDAASSSEPVTTPDAQERIQELEAEKAAKEAEKVDLTAREQDFRRREDPVQRISFAQEIFQLQQDQRRTEVEIEFIAKKIKRLQLGYAENAQPEGSPEGFVL